MPVQTEIPTRTYSPIKAPRGTELSCKGWHQEAAMRMLMNNLDEEVAERPQIWWSTAAPGKRRAQLGVLSTPSCARCKSLENDETLLVQSGKPVGIFDPRVRAARADLQFESRRPLVQLGEVQRTGTRRPDDVRPDDRRLVDLHRLAGNHPGYVRDISPRRPTSISAAIWQAS